MAAAILPSVLGGVGGLVGSLLKKKSHAAPAPTPGPIVMPIADDEAVRLAKKRSIAQQVGRGGRSSTILSADSDRTGTTLGG